jgi:hypothetical protein
MQVIYQTGWPMQRLEIGFGGGLRSRFLTNSSIQFLLFWGDKAGVGKSEKTGANWISALDHWLLQFDGKKGEKQRFDTNGQVTR